MEDIRPSLIWVSSGWTSGWRKTLSFAVSSTQYLGVSEATMLEALPLPLNIQDNARRPFSRELRRLRKEAIALAREEPIAREENEQRRMQ